MPVNVADGEGEAVRAVQASYADFIWGVPAAGEPAYPSLGVSTQMPTGGGVTGGLKVILVSEETPGASAGLKAGDVLSALDGAALRSKADLNRLLAAHHWGDRVVLAVEREGRRLEVPVLLRRQGAGSAGGAKK